MGKTVKILKSLLFSFLYKKETSEISRSKEMVKTLPLWAVCLSVGGCLFFLTSSLLGFLLFYQEVQLSKHGLGGELSVVAVVNRVLV